jgi:hypothetical protein
MLCHPTGDGTGQVSGDWQKANDHLVAFFAQNLVNAFSEIIPADVEIEVRGGNEQQPQHGANEYGSLHK